MGIPRLTQHLSPYATKVVFQHQDASHDGEQRMATRVVIDGPALAYHVYYVCLSRHGKARNALEAIPSYHDIGSATVRWLEQFEEYGFSMYVALLNLTRNIVDMSHQHHE